MILTGGASSRFGSDKSQAMLGESSLIETLLSTLPPEIETVIVGPEGEYTSRVVKYTQENPLGGGPVAAIHAGLALIEAEFVAVIATDMPFAGVVLKELAGHFPDAAEDATIPLDAQGIRQTLCAIYRAESLRSALMKLGNIQGQSMRRLTELLAVRELQLEPSITRILLDIDVPSDLEQAIILSKKTKEEKRENTMDKWIAAVQKELGINVQIDQDSILDLARDAAHGVERKAAPITTFLLGIAVAGGADSKKAAKRIADLARNWQENK